jgi:hypothetical protein
VPVVTFGWGLGIDELRIYGFRNPSILNPAILNPYPKECAYNHFETVAMLMDEIVAELDRLRDEAQAAFIARDVPGYMRIFSPYVRYRRTNGVTLNYGELTNDVERQMHVIPSIQISRTRESCDWAGDNVVEVVTQHTTMTATAFFVLTRIMEMTRKGRYVWTKSADGWRIAEVEILTDDVKAHWALGFVKPRRIS